MPPLPARPARSKPNSARRAAAASSPAAIVSAAIRQVANLHKMKLAVEDGDSDRIRHEARRAAGAFQPREGRGRSLRTWTPARLLRAMEQLAEASLETRRNAALRRDHRADARLLSLVAVRAARLEPGRASHAPDEAYKFI